MRQPGAVLQAAASEPVPRQERPHRADEAARVVAHHRVAGARHLDHLAPRQLTHEAPRRLAREDGALGAAQEERRATDLPHLLPQALEVRLQPAAADAGIELVAPAAVGALAERVAEAGADVLRRAERIEGLGARDRLLERGEVAHLELRRDRLAARLGDGGGDVDHDQAGDPLRVRRREGDRVQAAQAERDERRALPAAVVEEGADVGHEVVAAVAALGRPVGVAVGTLGEGEDGVVTRQGGRDLVPAVRGLRAAVEEQHGRLAPGAPVEEMEAEAVEGGGAVGGGGGHAPRLARRAALCPGLRAALTPARAAAIARRVIAVGEALATVCAAARVLGDERVVLAEALGRVAAVDVVSARAVPAAPNSAMDGFAVRHADLASVPARLRVVAVEPAGSVVDTPVEPGTAVKLFTRSVNPPRAATAGEVEDTEERDGTVVVRAAPAPGANVRPAGEDVRPGQVVVGSGTVIGPADLGVAASIGCGTLAVHRRPRVAILPTGAELVEVDQTPGPGQG